MKRVCVYCASSERIDPAYHAAANRVGQLLAEAGATIVYGGGGSGSMGALADGALGAGGEVIGILPRFMADLEWGHPGLTRLELVEDMRERKHQMLLDADAVVALPGGCGTFEELFEAITLKRLALYLNPIILLNTRGYFADCLSLLERAVDERFMNPEHLTMWQAVAEPDEVIAAIRSAPPWDPGARRLAVPR